MGGQSSQQGTTNQVQNQLQNTSQNQTQNTSQTTNPWAAASPFLQSVLGNAQGQLVNAGTINSLQQQGLAGLNTLAQAGNPYAGSIGDYATSLLGGGGALAQAPALQQGLSTYQSQLSPFTNAANLNPYNTPGLSTALNTLGTDITGQINSQFAAAGRDMSDSNTQALARGLSQGLANPLLSQYNTNVGNYLGAAGAGYGAGNTTAGLLSGLQQTYLANQGQGVNAATAAQTAQQQPYQQMLQIGSQMTGLPIQQLQALANIGIPIAGLGGTTTGTATGSGTGTTTGSMTGSGSTNQVSNMSPAQQAWGWMNAFGNLFKNNQGQ